MVGMGMSMGMSIVIVTVNQFSEWLILNLNIHLNSSSEFSKKNGVKTVSFSGKMFCMEKCLNMLTKNLD